MLNKIKPSIRMVCIKCQKEFMAYNEKQTVCNNCRKLSSKEKKQEQVTIHEEKTLLHNIESIELPSTIKFSTVRTEYATYEIIDNGSISVNIHIIQQPWEIMYENSLLINTGCTFICKYINECPNFESIKQAIVPCNCSLEKCCKNCQHSYQQGSYEICYQFKYLSGYIYEKNQIINFRQNLSGSKRKI